METIHLKTVDPVSQHLLRLAAQRGIELPWERYERLQPQDGFMRLGLSCPFECMHGPCRIDPFGRGPAAGICGLGRDEMVAAMLLRLCQRGAMEALSAVPWCNGEQGIRYSGSLGKLIGQVLSGSGQSELSCAEIVTASEQLQRPSCSYEDLLLQALRLGLLVLGLVEQAGQPTTVESLPCRSGYGVIADGRIRIGFAGQPPEGLISAFQEEVQGAEAAVALLALGEWLTLNDGFMPIGTTSGESELLLSSGAIHLLVAGRGTDPGILQLCGRMNIPVVTNGSVAEAADMVKRARDYAEQSSLPDPFADIPAGISHDVLMSDQAFSKILTGESAEMVGLVGGSDSPHLPLGRLPAELASKLGGNGIKLAGWGDAALWMARQGTGASTPMILENQQGPLLAVKGLAQAGRLDALRGICFTGMRRCQEFSLALGLAYIGCRVSIATPIPIQGSRAVMNALDQMLQQSNGQLLHFDHPATSDILSEWFTRP